MIQLYEYQEELIQGLRASFKKGHRKIVLCAPTGAGKTIMFTYMVKQHLEKQGRALILTDRINLLKQANGAFSKFGLKPELITAGSKPNLFENCHVAMVETLSRRAKKYEDFLASRTLVVVDEAHKTAFNKLFPYLSEDCLVIGATATPVRRGQQPSMSEFYTDIIQKVDTPDLIAIGRLSACNTFGMEVDMSEVKKKAGEYDPRMMGDMYEKHEVWQGVIENYNRICPKTKAICFAANIDSAIMLKHEMWNAGLPAMLIHSKQDDGMNQEIIDNFVKSKPSDGHILINVGILTAGFDCPDIQTVILYRATTSVALFLQMVGRGSRVTATKNEFTLLDFGNNVQEHDFWEARRTWSLEKDQKNLGVAPMKECPSCGGFIPAQQMICDTKVMKPEDEEENAERLDQGLQPILKPCGHIFVKTEEEKEEEARIAFLEPLYSMTKAEAMAYSRKCTIKEKAYMAKQKLVHPYWIVHTLTNMNDVYEFIKYMGYKKGWVYLNKDNFEVLRNNL